MSIVSLFLGLFLHTDFKAMYFLTGSMTILYISLYMQMDEPE